MALGRGEVRCCLPGVGSGDLAGAVSRWDPAGVVLVVDIVRGCSMVQGASSVLVSGMQTDINLSITMHGDVSHISVLPRPFYILPTSAGW